jgi:hypothetical protein
MLSPQKRAATVHYPPVWVQHRCANGSQLGVMRADRVSTGKLTPANHAVAVCRELRKGDRVQLIVRVLGSPSV